MSKCNTNYSVTSSLHTFRCYGAGCCLLHVNNCCQKLLSSSWRSWAVKSASKSWKRGLKICVSQVCQWSIKLTELHIKKCVYLWSCLTPIIIRMKWLTCSLALSLSLSLARSLLAFLLGRPVVQRVADIWQVKNLSTNFPDKGMKIALQTKMEAVAPPRRSGCQWTKQGHFTIDD